MIFVEVRQVYVVENGAKMHLVSLHISCEFEYFYQCMV